MADSLPREIWLAIMRSINDFDTYNSMARTCQLFAALARYEAERAKVRLARPCLREVSFAYPSVMGTFTVQGPALARGRFHGPCHSYNTMYDLHIEAREGLWHGEAVISFFGQRQRRFHLVDGEQQGYSITYSSDYTPWAATDPIPLYSLDCVSEHAIIEARPRGAKQTNESHLLDYYEDGYIEGPSIHLTTVMDVFNMRRGVMEGPSIITGDEGWYNYSYYEDGINTYGYFRRPGGTCGWYRGDDEECLTIYYDAQGSLSEIHYFEYGYTLDFIVKSEREISIAVHCVR